MWREQDRSEAAFELAAYERRRADFAIAVNRQAPLARRVAAAIAAISADDVADVLGVDPEDVYAMIEILALEESLVGEVAEWLIIMAQEAVEEGDDTALDLSARVGQLHALWHAGILACEPEDVGNGRVRWEGFGSIARIRRAA